MWRRHCTFSSTVLQTEGRQKQCIEDPNTSNSCREHIKLVEALASRDPERAREAMYRHVESTYNSLTTHRWAL
ncbi:MAG: FCD domain-containing protein [Burkholderiales bacterium]|nr:FCD domain-containing protein [Burkholderiales bacterium]